MRSSRRACFLTVAAQFALGVFAFAAPPQVTYLFPAGGQTGQTTNITATGTFSKWPVGAWCSRADVVVAAAKDKGKLDVQIAADAPPGIAWIRLHDEEGAATVRPFMIGTLPELNEQEPNDDPQKPQSLSIPGSVVNGQLGKTGDVDTFALPLRKGQTLVAAFEANRTLGSPVDGVVQIVSSAGFVLSQNDDDHGLDPRLAFVIPSDGTYLVRVFGFPATPSGAINLAGGESFVYRLTITSSGFVDAAWPLAVARGQSTQVELLGWNLPDAARLLSLTPADSDRAKTAWQRESADFFMLPVVAHPSLVETPAALDQPQTVEVPATITGRIAKPGETDVYEFAARKGEKLQVEIDSRGLGFPLDATLAVVDSAGKVLGKADDNARDSRDPELTVAIPADGQYRVQVRDLHRQGGARYIYRLTIAPSVPDFTLRVAADNFVIPKGKPLESPVTIERANGFAGEIEIAPLFLPEGVTAPAVKSQGKGETAKQVKLVFSAAGGPHQTPLRIAGTSSTDPALVRTAAFPLPAFNSASEDLWLTVQQP